MAAGKGRYCARDNITTECEVFTEGDPNSKIKYENCPKKECHDRYIPVNELDMNDLPGECRTKDFMTGLKLRCDLTVKVILNYTSMHRPLTYIDSDKSYPYSKLRGCDRTGRSGTGYIRADSIQFPVKGKPCPCRLCQEQEDGGGGGDPKSEYLEVSVFTATHLVFDNEEARTSVFECFFDSADRSDVLFLYGRSVTDPDELKRCVNDSCVVNCITHDPVLIQKLLKLAEKRGMISLTNPSTSRGVIISHPHGLSKRISFGKILYCGVHKDPRLPYDVSYEFGKDAKCRVTGSCSLDSQQNNCTNQNLTACQGNHKESTTSPGATISENEAGNSDSCTTLSSTSLLELNSIVVLPGNDVSESEYSLPPGMTFKLPLDSASFCTFQLPIKYGSKLWVKFPEGTEFFLPDGGRVVCLPPEKTEFCWSKGDATVNNKSCLYVTYDIATCPGSSGATVFRYCDNSWAVFPHFPHCGAQEDGNNRSSNIMVFCYYETWMAFPRDTHSV